MRTKIFTAAVILCIVLTATPKTAPALYGTNDRGTMTLAEYSTFLDILDAVEDGKDTVPYHVPVDHYSILSHLGLYYGKMDELETLIAWTNSKIILRLDQFQKFREHKIFMDAIVDEALSHIRDGSDRYMLWQVSRYIAKHLTYVEGEVMCGEYAILFYKMATRLGIPAYICFGYVGDGYHAWNMVELDGKEYHYDLTWYDTVVRFPGFLHASGWGRTYKLNNLWEGYV